MKKIKSNFLVFIILLPSAFSNAQVSQKDYDVPKHNNKHEKEFNSYSYLTKFGEVRFVDRDGKPAALASKISINGDILLSIEGMTDKTGSQQSLMTDDFVNPVESAPRKPGQLGPVEVHRIVASIGPTANCIKRFVILDFTGKNPFVSKPFSYNPDDRFCERLKKIKWGKKESVIDLAGPQRYLYRTYGEVIGPIEE
jgi:hypothetical protein